MTFFLLMETLSLSVQAAQLLTGLGQYASSVSGSVFRVVIISHCRNILALLMSALSLSSVAKIPMDLKGPLCLGSHFSVKQPGVDVPHP